MYMYMNCGILYLIRLSLETQISNDTSLEGSLTGIEIEDLTPIGKKYRDILTMGSRGGGREGRTEEGKREGTKNERGTEGARRKSDMSGGGLCDNDQLQHLHFSVHISPQVTGWSPSSANDVHVTVFVPSILYTHSVNLVYELEMFVAEFQQLSRAVMESFSSAAVGMAKGLVKEKSQFAEQLSTSLGPRSTKFFSIHSPGGPEIEATDAPLTFSTRDRLYLNICIQSPVITLPSSPHHDKCLVAYLGEITVENEFISNDLTDSLSTSVIDLPPEKERLTLKINNMSLHATHDTKSRALLVANEGSDILGSSGKWWKVLQETSVIVQIERRLGGTMENGEGQTFTGVKCGEDPPTIEVSGVKDDGVDGTELSDSSAAAAADVTVTGRICDPLLVRLPKEVFDQIRVTLKHSIHRNVPKRRKGDGSSLTEKLKHSRTVENPKSEFSLKSETCAETTDRLPSISASFSLPRLSLELKHTIGSKERNLVYISFDEFIVQCRKSDPHVTSIELALRSIVIEDLLQEKESEYRYLLASSSKPLRGPSRAPSTSPPLSLQGLSLSPAHLSPLTRPLLTLSHLMSSTPRVPLVTDSPLRSFTPQHNTGTSHTSSNPELTGDKHDHSFSHAHTETSFTTPKTSFKKQYASKVSGLASHRIRAISPETSSTSQKTCFKDEREEAGSTLLEDAGCHSNSNHSNLSDVAGLLSIKAMFVHKDCPEFESRYNSVS